MRRPFISISAKIARCGFQFAMLFFASRLAIALPLAVKADYSGDGNADFCVITPDNSIANNLAGKLVLYRGNGKAKFAKGKVVGKGWGSVKGIAAGGDFNGDGRPDFVALKEDSGLWLYNGVGKGGFSKRYLGFFYDEQIGAAGDFDEDGNDDFISLGVLVEETNSVSAFLNPGNGNGQFGLQKFIEGIGLKGWDLGPSADFNGDGHQDFVAYSPKGNVYLFRGNGTFKERRLLYDAGVILQLWKSPGVAADFNSDGRADLIISANGELSESTGRSNVYMLLQKNNGSFSPKKLSLSPPLIFDLSTPF